MAELAIVTVSGDVVRIDGLRDEQIKHAKENTWTYSDGKVVIVPIWDNPPAPDSTSSGTS